MSNISQDITYTTRKYLPKGKYFIGDISLILSSKNQKKFEEMYIVADLLFHKGIFEMSFENDNLENKKIHGFFEYGESEKYIDVSDDMIFKSKNNKPIKLIGCIEIIDGRSDMLAKKMEKKRYGKVIKSSVDFIPQYNQREDVFYILDRKIKAIK